MKNLLSNVIRASFDNWGQRHEIYTKLYSKLTKDTMSVIWTAFDELDDYKPGTFDAWWFCNHMRYRIRGDQQRLMHELMYNFLADYYNGKIGEKFKKTRAKTQQKAAAV